MSYRRNEDNCIPGFNLAVIDIDTGATVDTARMLMQEYTYMLYTTKRHTPQENRFRMIFPLSHIIKLDAVDYKEFMLNLYDWLPFEVDRQTNQRSRKWLSNSSTVLDNQGELLDALLFIPKTKSAEKQKQTLLDQTGLNNVERWFINRTATGNRSNQFIRYGLMLVDNGFDLETIRDKLLILNSKLAEKMDESDLFTTILLSVNKAITKRNATTQ